MPGEPTATGPLLTAAELATRLQTTAQHSGAVPVVLDVRWDLGGGADPDGFAAAHVPGALLCDLEVVLSGPGAPDGTDGRHPLPHPADVRTWLRAHRIAPGDPVVVMDGGHGAGAARAWWVLRDAGQQDVRVLDGGLRAWRAAGLPLEQGPAADPVATDDLPAPSAEFREAPGALPRATAPQLRGGLPAGTVGLDARPAARYRGEELGPDPVGGHLPGFRSLPVADLYSDGVLRDPEEVRARLADAGVDATTPVVVSCGSGITACQVALAHQQVFPGAPEPVLYPPSFSGWLAGGHPLATGAEPGTMPPA